MRIITSIACICICVLTITIMYFYIKKKRGFWVSQPVFHVYDIGYLLHLYSYGIINSSIPTSNDKYINNINITTTKIGENTKDSHLDFEEFHKFISKHYLSNEDIQFSPSRENIDPYFIGHSISPLLTVYWSNVHKQLVQPTTSVSTMVETSQQMVSAITSRCVTVVLKDMPTFKAQYIDYLCVNKHRRCSGVAPQMIRTHYANQRRILSSKDDPDPSIVCVFKREGDLTGIVPMCVYTCYGYETINKWPRPKNRLPYGVEIVKITGQSYFKVRDFINTITRDKLFDTIIHTDHTNILELVKTGNLFIYARIDLGKISDVYIFRKSCTFLSNKREILSLIASIHNPLTSTHQFVIGFKWALFDIMTQTNNSKNNNSDSENVEKTGFEILEIEDISHNRDIITHIQTFIPKSNIESMSAYFFYNYAYPTIKSSNAFIVL